MKHPDTLGPVLASVDEIDLACAPGTVDETSFIPGVAIRNGGLIYDPSRLITPGDLLHEAGHLAAVPSRWRGQIHGDVDAALSQLSQAEPDAAGIAHTDLFPIAWSWAAARHIGIDPACIFDAGGYGAPGGGDPSLLDQQLASGVFPGIFMLTNAGLCAAPPPFGDGRDAAPFPHMTRWLAA